MKTACGKFGLVSAIVAIFCLLVLLYWLLHDEAAALMSYVADEETHPLLFIGLYVALPLFGFPISPFLVFLGIKFGSWLGVLIMFAGMPLHLFAALFVAHSILRSWLRRLFEKLDCRLPKIPAEREAWFGFVFMAVPGLSYALKNYILALSGISKRIFFYVAFWFKESWAYRWSSSAMRPPRKSCFCLSLSCWSFYCFMGYFTVCASGTKSTFPRPER